MNLCEFPAKSLADYVTSDPVYGCARIRWDGEVVMSADELLAAKKGEANRGRCGRRVAPRLPKDGPRESEHLKEASQIAGYSWPTIRRAGKVLGVEKYKPKGMKNGRWFWRLSSDEHEMTPLSLLPSTNGEQVGAIG